MDDTSFELPAFKTSAFQPPAHEPPAHEPLAAEPRVEPAVLAGQFQQHRPRLRSVAYRMLGSMAEADDAVQETWIRLSRSDASDIDNVGGWLTTVVARVSLSMLQRRARRREDSLNPEGTGDIASPDSHSDPEQQTLTADAVGLALLVVLDTLTPAERLAFVLHDSFGVPFEEIARIVDRTPAAARQLASRARRRVQGAAGSEDPDPIRRRRVVDAFLAASRNGDFNALVRVLDPDVVLRADRPVLPDGPTVFRGAHTVARQALRFSGLARSARQVMVDGRLGLLAEDPGGRPVSLLSFRITADRVTGIDIVTAQNRLAELGFRADPGIVRQENLRDTAAHGL